MTRQLHIQPSEGYEVREGVGGELVRGELGFGEVGSIWEVGWV